MNEKDKQALILKYTELVIKKRLRGQELTKEEQQIVDEAPKMLNMNHRDIILAASQITLQK